MRVFADAGGSLSLLSEPLMISLALVLLALMVSFLTATLIVWRVYRRVRRWRGWNRGAAATRSRALRPGRRVTSPGCVVTCARRSRLQT